MGPSWRRTWPRVRCSTLPRPSAENPPRHAPPPRCIPAFQSVIASARAGQRVPVQEFSILRRDGSTFPAAVAVSISRPRRRDGRALWSIHDRSGQKEVEETLRESREYYQELTANISDAFITLDREGRIISRNRAAARLSGNPEEVLGKSIYDAYLISEMRRLSGSFGRSSRPVGPARMSAGFTCMVKTTSLRCAPFPPVRASPSTSVTSQTAGRPKKPSRKAGKCVGESFRVRPR